MKKADGPLILRTPLIVRSRRDFFRTKIRVCEKEPVLPPTVRADNDNDIEPLARIGRGIHQDAAVEMLLRGGAEKPEHWCSPSRIRMPPLA
jgi:hypothetical protein